MKTKAFKPTRNKLAQAIALGVLALAANQAHATDYTFSDLGTITGPYAGTGAGANGINNLGQVVGYANGSANNNPDNFIPYLWNGDTATQLDNGPGGVGALGIRINDAGQIAGYGQDDSTWYGIRWDGTRPTKLDTLGGYYSEAYGINNHGQLVGDRFP